MTSLKDAVVLVTGANGGIGGHFVREALARGAAKVYASARNPQAWDDERVVPLTLDVTDAASIKAAVESAPDVTVLINNAGVAPASASLITLSEEDLRSNMETNFFGPLLLARAFAPALKANKDAAVVNIHSLLSWLATAGVYSVSKAALWSATNALRLELAPHDVHVVGVHVGWVDTPMAAHVTEAKVQPAVFVGEVFDALQAGDFEVLADEASARIKSGLSAEIEVLYPQLNAADAKAV